MTKILPCTCDHDFQDRTYGSRRRVHNETVGTPPKYRCTVCSDEKSDAPKSAPKA